MFNNLYEVLRLEIKKSVMIGMYGGNVNSALFNYGFKDK